MKKIIANQFGRRWLMWSFFSLLSMAAGLVVGIERDIRISCVLFTSISIATIDWGLGGPRVLLSLPFTARQIGRAYWWMSVGVPTLSFAVFSAIGILILSLARTHGKFLGTWFQMFIEGPPDKFPGIWFESVVAGGLLCGSFFWLMTGAVWAAALSREGVPWRKRFLRQFYVWAFAIALLTGIYLLCKSTISITDKVFIAYLCGFVFSVLGWFRAESLFIGHCSFRRDVAVAGKARGKFEPRPGYGGVPYLIIRFCLFYLTVVAVMIASIVAVGNIAAWLNHRAKWSDIVSPVLLGFQIYLFILCFCQTMIIGTHLKFLRSLPLTSKQLAATILCLAIVPALIFGGTSMLYFLVEPGVLSALSILKVCLLNFAAVWILTAGVIWCNEQFRRITGVLLAWIVSIVPIIYELATANRGGLPTWMLIAIPVVSVIVASFALKRLLERNEMAYRIKFETLPNWP